MSELTDNTTLYRAIRKKGWIDPDTKEIDPEVFLLRPGERGLSANLTPESTYDRLKKCYGVVSFSVADLKSLGLSLIQDSKFHVTILNLPDSQQNRKQALDLAIQLANKSQLYLDWLDRPCRNDRS